MNSLFFILFIAAVLVPSFIAQYAHPMCLVFQEDFPYQCLKCKKEFILDQSGTLCNHIKQENINCVQISELGECLRCDCGFSLHKQMKKCTISPPHLIGCESYNEQDICLRPKKDYFLIKSFSGKILSIQSNAGSNCEIFNQEEGTCQQCHSGYLLNYQNLCEKYPHHINNVFFTYFSTDGELKSRSIWNKVTKNGAYFPISRCEIHQEIEGSIQCFKCQHNKIPNKSRKKCNKSPIQNCGIASDTDSNICEECIDNFHFYLNIQKTACLPRSKDPTEKCLESSDNNISCLKCSNGLVNSIQGCDLAEQQIIDLENEESQAILSIRIIGRKNSNCIYKINENRCGKCEERFILDTEGNCQKSNSMNCLILNSEKKCEKCNSNFYYDKEEGICQFIQYDVKCLLRDEIKNVCLICYPLYYLNEARDICIQINNKNCISSDGKINKCMKCQNLFFLQNEIECLPITEQDNCFLSNGISNKCIQIKRKIIINEYEIYLPTKKIIDSKQCSNQSYYISENNECVQYTFNNYQKCFAFHPTKNQCKQCISGYYIDVSYGCQTEGICIATNGIEKHCYLASSEVKSYINENGEIVKSECYTNSIEMTCINNNFYNQSIGILSQCQRQFIENCYHQKEQIDGKCICEICYHLFYPHYNGNCLPIRDKECQVSNGRNAKCVLCKISYQLNDLTGLCELKKDLIFPFCAKIKEDQCIKCQSLFYLNKNICFPIEDPDCIESEGILNECPVCKDQIRYSKFFSSSCFNPCEKFDEVTKICILCTQGFIPMIFPFTNKKQIVHCQFNTTSNCLELNSDWMCSLCEEGYHLNLVANRMMCIERFIENCQTYDFNSKSCSSCEEGFILLSDETCYKIPGCLESQKNICIICEQNYILFNGNCLQIPNCLHQQEFSCFLCLRGFSIQFLHGKNVTHHLLSQEINELFDTCEKIPNCFDSNGINTDCLICEEGFKLIQGICFREIEITQNCLKQDQLNVCIKCENLFYIESGICLKVKHQNCQQSNGISMNCLKCIFSGYQLNKYGKCEMNENCIISDGIDICIICKQGYIVDEIGRCQLIEVEIENCQEYSYNFKDVPQSEYEIKMKDSQIMIVRNQKQYELQILKEQVISQQQYCIKCSNFYSLMSSFFTACETFTQAKSLNCLQNDGVFEECTICKQGALPYLLFSAENKENINIGCLYQKNGEYHKNIGCQYFHLLLYCIKCFNSFYLDSQSQCRPKKFIQKCHHFHPTKDECQICRSGYILTSINQNKSICIPLAENQKVKDCHKYKANSNKCIQCRKYIQFDILEFILDEKNNSCESVIHYMCQEFDLIQRKCSIQYINNCQLHHNSTHLSGCSKCKNGFFMTPQLTCQQHQTIQNCLIYSQTEKNSCEQCQKLYFLSYNNEVCSPISTNNCLLASRNIDQCIYCEKQQIDGKLC